MERSKLIQYGIFGIIALGIIAYQFDTCGENEKNRLITEKKEREDKEKRDREEEQKKRREEEQKKEDRIDEIRRKASQIEGTLRTDWVYPNASMTGTIQFQKSSSAPVFKFNATTVDFVIRDGKIHAICKDNGECIQYKNEQLGDYGLKEFPICGASDEILALFNKYKELVGESMKN